MLMCINDGLELSSSFIYVLFINVQVFCLHLFLFLFIFVQTFSSTCSGPKTFTWYGIKNFQIVLFKIYTTNHLLILLMVFCLIRIWLLSYLKVHMRLLDFFCDMVLIQEKHQTKCLPFSICNIYRSLSNNQVCPDNHNHRYLL